jgi:hypothetical protein
LGLNVWGVRQGNRSPAAIHSPASSGAAPFWISAAVPKWDAMTTSPAQIWARLIGWTLVLAGIAGFFYSSAFGSPGKVDAVFGILDVNGFHNLVHLLTGLLGIALAGSFAKARFYALFLAVAYSAVAIWGFVVGDGGTILSILPVNTEDNVLHALIAVVSLAVGVGQSSVPAPSTHEPGPGFRYN